MSFPPTEVPPVSPLTTLEHRLTSEAGPCTALPTPVCLATAAETLILWAAEIDRSRKFNLEQGRAANEPDLEQRIKRLIGHAVRVALQPEWGKTVPGATQTRLATIIKDLGPVVPSALPGIITKSWETGNSCLTRALEGKRPRQGDVTEPDPVPITRIRTLFHGRCFPTAYNYATFVLEKNKTADLVVFKLILANKMKTQSGFMSLLAEMPKEVLFEVLHRFRSFKEKIQGVFHELVEVKKEVFHKIHSELCYGALYMLTNGKIEAPEAPDIIMEHAMTKPGGVDVPALTKDCLDVSVCAPLITALATGLVRTQGIPAVKLQATKLYLKATTLLLNQLEILRNDLAKAVQFDAAETLLAGLFEAFATLHADSDVLYREVLLTAFSIRPSRDLLDKITACADKIVQAEQEKMDSSTDVKPLQFGSFDETGFNTLCDDFEASLADKTFSWSRSRLRPGAAPLGDEGLRSAVDGILSIEGSVLTNAASYDPSKAPMGVFAELEAGLGEEMVRDIIVALTAPRWHMLSWVIQWKTLEERCLSLLANPSLRITRNPELKHLVIDYTQFDEWSSDEDEEAPSLIERGYEQWDVVSDDEDE